MGQEEILGWAGLFWLLLFLFYKNKEHSMCINALCNTWSFLRENLQRYRKCKWWDLLIYVIINCKSSMRF